MNYDELQRAKAGTYGEAGEIMTSINIRIREVFC